MFPNPPNPKHPRWVAALQIVLLAAFVLIGIWWVTGSGNGCW